MEQLWRDCNPHVYSPIQHLVLSILDHLLSPMEMLHWLVMIFPVTLAMSVRILEEQLLSDDIDRKGASSYSKARESSLESIPPGEWACVSPPLTVAVMSAHTDVRGLVEAHFLCQGSLALHSLAVDALTNSLWLKPVGF